MGVVPSPGGTPDSRSTWNRQGEGTIQWNGKGHEEMFGTGKIAANADEHLAAVSTEAIRDLRIMTAGLLVFLGLLFIVAVRNAH